MTSPKEKKPDERIENPRHLFTLDVLGYKVPVFRAKMAKHMGLFTPERMEIYINDNLAAGPAAEVDTLLHEVAHCAACVILPADERGLSERHINILSTMLIEIFRRNRMLWNYLDERIRAIDEVTPNE